MKSKFIRVFLLLLVSAGIAPLAEAGHLFTQASSNTPINLTAGFGINVTQSSYETWGSSNGQVDIDFNDERTTGDPNLDWSAGDEITVTIGSWSQKYAYDTSGSDADLAGYSQDGGNINANDLTLAAANIAPSPGDTWTVIANAGSFTFSGYRIYVTGGYIFNGTNAGTINQNQVVTETELGGSGFEPAAESNQTDLGQHLDDIGGSVTGDLATIITELDGLEDDQKAEAMKRISPEQSSAMTQSVASSTSTSLDTVQVRLDSLRFGTTDGEPSGLSSGDELSKFQDRSTWIKFIGGKSKRDGKSGFAGADSDFAGIMVGVDATTDEKLTLGAAFAYGKTDVSLNDYRDGDSADIDTYQLTGYFTYPVDKFYLEGMVSYAKNDYSTSRNTHISGIAKGDFDGEAVSARLVAGYPMHREGQGTFVPYAGLEALHINQDDYTESGAGALSLTVADSSADRIGSLLGIKFSFDKELSDGSVLTPTFDARWRHEFKKDGVTTTSSFVGGGGNFQSVGQDVDSDLLGLSARLNWAKTEDYSLGFEVDGAVAEGYVAGNIQLFGTWRF